MKDFALVSVWYHKNKFIYNTTCYPFWHNILYHAQFYKYYVLYYVEQECAVNIPYAGPVKFINFRQHSASQNMCKLKEVYNKIDYMKLQFLFNCDIVTEKHLLLMDMDCQLTSLVIDEDRIRSNKYFLTPYIEPKCKYLHEPRSPFDHHCNSFNSYIENYAVLINKNNDFFDNHHGVSVTVENETNEFFMHAQYIQIVILYMCIRHQYAMPTLLANYNIESVVPLTLYRGASYDKFRDEYVYEYDYRKPAEFGKPSLTKLLYRAILSNVCQDELKLMLHNLKRLGYDFKSKFEWSNSLQCKVNVYGCIEDRYKVPFNYSGVEFVLPLVKFEDKYTFKPYFLFYLTILFILQCLLVTLFDAYVVTVQ